MLYKESQKMELKSTLGEWKEIIVSLAAFANQEGGKVVIGVTDDGDVVKNILHKGSLEDLANKIKNNTDPQLFPSINLKTFGPADIIEVEIPESDFKPVFALDRAYIRVGKTNQKLSNHELRKLIQRYTLPEWDKQACSWNLEQDLDVEYIKEIAKADYKTKLVSKRDVLTFWQRMS